MRHLHFIRYSKLKCERIVFFSQATPNGRGANKKVARLFLLKNCFLRACNIKTSFRLLLTYAELIFGSCFLKAFCVTFCDRIGKSEINRVKEILKLLRINHNVKMSDRHFYYVHLPVKFAANSKLNCFID